MPIGRGDQYGRMPDSGTWKHLDRIGPSQDRLVRFLYPFSSETIYLDDNFLVDTINLDVWTTGETGSGTPFAVPGTPGIGGTVAGVTGTSSGDTEVLYGAPIWAGDYNCGIEIIAAVDNIVNCHLEFGFVDPVTSFNASVVNDIDTPSYNAGAADVALLAIDTAETLTTMALVTDGSTSNYNATKTTLSPVFTPTNATEHIYRVQLQGDIVLAMVDGKSITSTASGLAAERIEGGVALHPWICVKTRTTAARTLTVNRVRVWQDRAARTS